MKKFRQILLGVLVFGLIAGSALTGCKKKAANPFPASGAIAGWEKAGETRTFEPKDLWQYIDGDSEQYIQAGVVSTSTSDYKYKGQLEAVVDVYTMGGPDGAQTILERGQTKDAKTIKVGDEGLQYAQSVTFRKGPYLVRIVAYQAGSQTAEALVALAHGVETNL
ncbi:MAG TPA: DUF6599 family protein [Terracidiphilus sp.]|jgi:hypothetical protein|nr:DUF6599 family protein [Terracidiphilus sp.]